MEAGKEEKGKKMGVFKDLENVYDRGNKEALLHFLRMYDVGGKLLSKYLC